MAVVPAACTRVRDWNLIHIGLVRAKWTLVPESTVRENHNLQRETAIREEQVIARVGARLRAHPLKVECLSCH